MAFYRRQRTAVLRSPATFSPLRQPWLPPRISTLSIGLVGEEAEAIGRPGTVPQAALRRATRPAAGDARPGGRFLSCCGGAEAWRRSGGRGRGEGNGRDVWESGGAFQFLLFLYVVGRGLEAGSSQQALRPARTRSL